MKAKLTEQTALPESAPEQIESVLEPLIELASAAKSETQKFDTARTENKQLRDDLIEREAELNRKIAELARDEDLGADPEEVALRRLLAPAAVEIVENRLRRLGTSAKKLVEDTALKAAYTKFSREYENLSSRIISVHHDAAFGALETALGPTDNAEDTASRHKSADTSASVTRVENRLIEKAPGVFKTGQLPYTSHREITMTEIYAALDTTNTATLIEDVDAAISAIHSALKDVDLAKLPLPQPEEPTVSAPTARRSFVVTLPPQPSSLRSGNEVFSGPGGMVETQRKGTERAAEEMREQKAAGMLPPAVADKVA